MVTDRTEQDMQEFGASMAVALRNVEAGCGSAVTAQLIRKEVRRLVDAAQCQVRTAVRTETEAGGDA